MLWHWIVPLKQSSFWSRSNRSGEESWCRDTLAVVTFHVVHVGDGGGADLRSDAFSLAHPHFEGRVCRVWSVT